MSKVSDFSENEDDPAVYESSGSEWSSGAELEPVRKTTTRRASSRVSKKPRLKSESSSSEIDDDPKPRKRNGVNKKQKIEPPVDEQKNLPKTINAKDFSTGSFLILKKDAQVGDPKKHPCIWRVDGKALLQKYEPFDEEGKIRHKTTSIYTGWSALDRDLYAPVTVTVTQHRNQILIVDLDWEKLKEINMDSD
ncbi:uncharacterized protein LOC123014254 [Tribolium madens]|uniref:uncharacterized protein LOC123014254 n=1 Tax=Tribolium madens TaxID=41895 RepID=UPI001CF74118|nr:uncharacterized protein LOC123014254 [Tribolium madens]